jgi:putative hydrolase of the HAD superfamily
MKGMPSPQFNGRGRFVSDRRPVFKAPKQTQRVIFFDINDTLIDQCRAEAQAACQLLTLYGDWLGRACSVAEFCRQWRELRTKHNPAFFAGEISLQEQRRRRKLFARCQKQLSECEVDLFFAFYEHHYRRNWSLFDDVLPFFRSRPGYACGIISNGSAAQQKLKFHRTGIAGYFDVIVVAEEIGVGQPDREIFLGACEQARCPAGRCVHVGDSLERDVLASRAAGMRSIWLDRKHAQADVPVATVGSLTELRSLLESRMDE